MVRPIKQIPRSMSVAEAQDYVADPRNWLPDAGVDESGDGEYVEPEEGIGGNGAAEAYEAEFGSVEPTEDYQALMAAEAAHDEAGQDVNEAGTLRPIEAIDADIDFVCGPAALAKPKAARHYATLRLIDDLLVARDQLGYLVSVVNGVKL